MAEFDELANVLFEGDVVASDIKTMPGTGTNLSRDEMAKSLIESMRRVGLVKNGSLVDPNK
jgi:hypothetical protein